MLVVKDVYIDEQPLLSLEEMSEYHFDRMRFGHDLLLYKVTQYVIKTRRQTEVWLQILEELAQ